MIEPTEDHLVSPSTGSPREDLVLELSEEMIAVARRTAPTQTIRITTTTNVHNQQVEEELGRETIEIERVPIGRVVEAAPEIRVEGDVTIIPVMEEVLVLERRLVLKEEVRARRVRTTEIHRETVRLRDQTATITRTEPGEAAAEQHTLQPSNGRPKP